MNLKSINSVYLVGIGGIGMSALARYFIHLGKHVAGYDKTATDLTSLLITEGIEIHFTDNVNLITDTYKDKSKTLVIYTPAVPTDHKELNYFRQEGFSVLKRAEVLGLITCNYKAIAIAGTHGKTTVSSMVAHILKQSEVDCNAFLGGISKNYNSNLLLSNSSEFAIVEADEFDRSFLHLQPTFAVITSADADHLDIYGNKESIKQSFEQFIQQIVPKGKLVIKKNIDVDSFQNKEIQRFEYAIEGPADFYAENIIGNDGFYTFNLVTPFGKLENLQLGIPGLLNVENAIAAVSMAILAGVKEVELQNALKSFAGIKRRFDYQIKTNDLVYIDDYAHHPEELKATILSVKKIYPTKKITGIFQPHLYSRTRDLADGFVESLGLLDELILLDIYPARELPIEGVSSEMIFNRIKLKNKVLCAKKDLLEVIKKSSIEVLLTMGAGDIDTMVEPIKNMLKID